MVKLVPDGPGAWSRPVRERLGLYWPSDEEGYWAVVTVWGTGGRISFGRVGSDCPTASFPLRPRYWCLGYVQELRDPAMKYLKQMADVAKRRRVKLSDEEEAFQARYVALGEYLTTDRWPNGDMRLTSTLSLFVDDGVWKVCLNDRQEELVLFATGDSMLGVLEALEATLRAGTGDWRRSMWSKAKSGNKRNGKPVDRR